MLYFISVSLSSWLDPESSVSLDTNIRMRMSRCVVEIHSASLLPTAFCYGRLVPTQGGEKEELHMLLIRTGSIGTTECIRRYILSCRECSLFFSWEYILQLPSWRGPHCHCIEPRAWEEAAFYPWRYVNVMEGIANYIS